MKKILCAFLCFISLNAQSDFKDYFTHLEKRQEFEISKLQSPFFNTKLEQIYKLEIQAVFLDKVKINNTWYKQNDFINGARISAIKPKQILLEYNKITISLELKNNDKISID